MLEVPNRENLSDVEYFRLRRERYLILLQGGFTSNAAARIVGVSRQSALKWRNGRSRGKDRKRTPPCLAFYNLSMEKRDKFKDKYSKKFLTLEERANIYLLLRSGNSRREIARQLNRHHSCIIREIEKNSDIHGNYAPFSAEQRFRKMLSRPRMLKVDKNVGLWICILKKLKEYWSPMQISKHLKETNPGNPEMHLSHESIYRAIYVQGKGHLKEELKKLMRQGREMRKPRRRKEQEQKPRFKDTMLNISQRPAEANDRAIPGHWEGDLIIGKNIKSAIGTLVERSTRFCILLHLPNGHTAEAVQKEIVRKMKKLPEQLRKTLAWDRGSELALHSKISKELDMKVFFCDPHSPWQRGTNENTNGLLRQYFPKGTDLSVYSDNDLDNAAKSLNNRPRMTLGWKSPAQKFLELQNSFE